MRTTNDIIHSKKSNNYIYVRLNKLVKDGKVSDELGNCEVLCFSMLLPLLDSKIEPYKSMFSGKEDEKENSISNIKKCMKLSNNKRITDERYDELASIFYENFVEVF